MWLCACAMALMCAALADADSFKRAEMSPSTFVLTTRYGRSPLRTMSSRSDRFMLVSRYGKRSDASLAERRISPKLQGNTSGDKYREWQKNRDRERDRNYALHKWRSRCYCIPYKTYPFVSYYRRSPVTLDNLSDAD